MTLMGIELLRNRIVCQTHAPNAVQTYRYTMRRFQRLGSLGVKRASKTTRIVGNSGFDHLEAVRGLEGFGEDPAHRRFQKK